MPKVDWSAKLTTTETVMCTAVAAATTATAGVYADLAAGAPLAIAGAAAAGTAIYSNRTGKTLSTTIVRATSWLTAGAWSSFHLATQSPPTTAGWVTGAAAAILAAAMNYRASITDPERANNAAILAFKKQAVRTLDEWDKRLEDKLRSEVRCYDMEPWPEQAGYSLAVEFTDGKTWKDIKMYEEAFASELGLPNGCGVEIAAGDSRNKAIIRVSTRDMISAEVFYEEDFSPLTYTEPFTFAFHRDGTDAFMSLLDDCGLLIGETGSGKTNLLNTIIMQLARMPDVLIWVIDITGAGVALPWIAPWALKEDGRDVQASAPIVDWVAYDVAEAYTMLSMAIQIIGHRKARYQKLMRSKNTDKIPITPDIPAICIVADETAELPPKIQGLIDSVMNTGRATRVRNLNCGLRATQDTITAAMKKQAKNRIGMSVTDPEELSYLFSGYQVLDPADAPVPGSGFYTGANKAGAPRPFKARRIIPDIITAGCIACADRRPRLDKISCEVDLYSKYKDRWARALPALFPDEFESNDFADEVQKWLDSQDDQAKARLVIDEDEMAGAFTGGGSGGTGGGYTTAEGNPSNVPSVADMQKMFSEAEARFVPPYQPDAPTPSTPVEQAPTPAEDTADDGDELQQVLNRTGEPHGGLPTAPVLPFPTLTHKPKSTTPRGKALQWLYEAGPDGTSATRLHERLKEELDYDGARTTVQGWLAKWAEKEGKAVKVGEGSHTRYVHVDFADQAEQ
ncbi:hypothetical protein ACFU0X_20590 [Streptomyces cellulosae]|uniref:FtsK domain-containing protein n=1 Tax=Streptomyces cellulosae TaxID=1968 RepID=A0ABW6JLZ0_STRCE